MRSNQRLLCIKRKKVQARPDPSHSAKMPVAGTLLVSLFFGDALRLGHMSLGDSDWAKTNEILKTIALDATQHKR
jgi:hypothetical protein